METWEEPHEFEDHDEILRPVEWRHKLEILEAQVALNSGSYGSRQFMTTVSRGDHIHQHRLACQMLSRVARNLQRMQDFKFCGDRINIVVADFERPNVAQLVPIEVEGVLRFKRHLATFMEEPIPLPLYCLRKFLHECMDFLLSVELPVPAFRDYCRGHPLDRGSYMHVASRNSLISAITYAIRAIAIILDIGCLSFCGAHLKDFDTFYFATPARSYKFPYDSEQTSLYLTRHHFDCLDGFFLGREVWVFSVQKDSSWSLNQMDVAHWYLSTTPEDFANIWGPMWRYISRKDEYATMWFLASPGFIVPAPPHIRHPDLLRDEVLCHWIKDSDLLDETTKFPVRGVIRRLMIGARLEENPDCATVDSEWDGKFKYEMKVHGFKGENPDIHGPFWTWNRKIQIPVSLTVGLGPTKLQVSANTEMERKPGSNLLDCIRTRFATDPLKVLEVLEKYYGVEISACTGNARRVTLLKLLSSQTMQNLLRHQFKWKEGEQEKLLYALNRDVDHVHELIVHYRDVNTVLSATYESALTTAIVALAEWTGMTKHSIYALWVGKKYSDALRIKLLLQDCQWAGLLANDNSKCSLFVVNHTCLQCTADKRLGCNKGIFTLHQPIFQPLEPIASVLETTLVLNYTAEVPPPLQDFKKIGELRPEMFKKLRKGDYFTVPHGRLWIIEPLSDFSGLFVEWEYDHLRDTTRHRVKSVKTFLQQAYHRKQRDLEDHWEQVENEPSEELIPIFVVSDPKRLGLLATRP